MTTAAEYLALEATLPPHDQRTEEQQDALKTAYGALPMYEKRIVGRAHVEAYFVPENKAPTSRESLSPSGRYRLVVTSYGTKPGSWSYARGEVYRVSDGQLVADVKRNYSAFPASWVEGHPNGHDYLICGEDYQGQTVVELTTGRRRDELPDAAEKGHGFCWAGAVPTPDKTMLLVDGCFWACPYEHRVHAFSDPMGEGWPELEVEDGPCLYAEEHSALSYENGLFVYVENTRVFLATGEREDVVDARHSDLFRAKHKAEKSGDAEALAAATKALAEHDAAYPCEDEDADKWSEEPDHRVVLNRVGDKLVVVEEWKSEHVLAGERRRAEWDAKWKEDSTRYRAEDPYYQQLVAGVEPEKAHARTHFSLPSMNMRDEGDTNPAYFHVALQDHEEDRKRTASLEWGVAYGDFKLDLWTRGKGSVSRTFPRTAEGFAAARGAASAHTTGGAV